MDSKFKSAQRAYDNMSPEDDKSLYHEPHYPCDVCGYRDIVIVPDGPEHYGANCCRCSRRVRWHSNSPDAAIESWEDAMMESEQEAKEDRRNGGK